jgi:hypothetical protein
MKLRSERRAAALEAIAHALMDLAAVEREPDEAMSPIETLIDRRNCERELGITSHAFVAAAGRHFTAFRVSKRLTATKADVLAWRKTRKVEPKVHRPAVTPRPPDPDTFLKAVHARFVSRVRRPMTDQELSDAELWIDVGRGTAKQTGHQYADTPDDIVGKFDQEPFRHGYWRSYGLDSNDMDRKGSELREKIHVEHPDWDWRQRQHAVEEMWSAITGPLSEARQKARTEKRAAKNAERAKAGQLGLRK